MYGNRRQNIIYRNQRQNIIRRPVDAEAIPNQERFVNYGREIQAVPSTGSIHISNTQAAVQALPSSRSIDISNSRHANSPSIEAGPYTHFISLPLAIHPELVNKLVNFQNCILGNGYASQSATPSDLGIDKSIFAKPKSLHLTVLMLKLWNKERVNAATEVLNSISSKVMDALDNQPVFIRLKGLDCMKGSPDKAQVLYAPVEEIGDGDRLLRACHTIIDAFTEAGLVLETDAKQKLKLHATVMNARFRKRSQWTRGLDSFDARGIFQQFGSMDWGQYLIGEAHLSQRMVFDESGYYHCCASLPFPANIQ